MSEILKRTAELLRTEAQALEDSHTTGNGDWGDDLAAKAAATEFRDLAGVLSERQSQSRLAREILQSDPDFKVLTRFEPVDRYTDDSQDLRLGVVVDTETTGLDADASIIEIGVVLFSYSPSAKIIHAIVDSYSGLEDPGFPIPENITQVTGITTADVAGKTIDWARVASMAARARFAIAHNASFDRPLLEKRCESFVNMPWACSLNDIDWSTAGIASSKLDYIAFKLGFFFGGHRAETDCRALLHILTQTLPDADVSLFGQMARSAAQPSFRVWAVNASFDVKDALKARGYRWNDGTDRRPKAWHKDVQNVNQLQIEHDWLRQGAAYPQRDKAPLAIPVESISAMIRYSDRRGEIRPMNELVAGESPDPEPVPVVPMPVSLMPPHPAAAPSTAPSEQGSLWGELPPRTASPRG
jgi:DNA polymerase-3 subunit epsilon